MNPRPCDFRNVTSFQQLINVYSNINCASSEDTRRRTYDNPLEVADGCIDSGIFLNAVTTDVTKRPIDFRATCAALHVRNTNAYVRALATSANAFIDANGTYATYKEAYNAAQNQRNRIKTFAKHWIAQLTNEIKTNYGRNTNFVNCIEDGSGEHYGVFCAADSALVFDSSNQRTYVLFANNPSRHIRMWLRQAGFQTSSTNYMWYKDLQSIDTQESCVEFASEFATMLSGAYNAEIANLRIKVRQLRPYTAR